MEASLKLRNSCSGNGGTTGGLASFEDTYPFHGGEGAPDDFGSFGGGGDMGFIGEVFVCEIGFEAAPLTLDVVCFSCGLVGNKPEGEGLVGDTATDPEMTRD